MKRFKKFLVGGLTMAAMLGTAIPAWGTGVSTYGMIDERSVTKPIPAANGGGNLYTWSQANVSANSLYLMDQSISASYSKADIYNQMSVNGKHVYFDGDYNLTSNGWWSYHVDHDYSK